MTHPWHCPNTLLYFKLVEKMFLLSSSFHFSLFTAEKGWRKHDALIKCQWNTPLLSKLCLHRQRCQFDWEKVWFVVFRWESAGTMNLCANVAFLCFKKKVFTGFLLFPLHHCGLCATDCSAVQKTFKCSKTSEPLVVKTGVFNGS